MSSNFDIGDLWPPVRGPLEDVEGPTIAVLVLTNLSAAVDQSA
jgi:hypothetical protein